MPALHWDQKTQSEPEQHCAREAEVERVKGKSQVRRSETVAWTRQYVILLSMFTSLEGSLQEGGGGS